MCTVTYLPYRDGFILTHNRDEAPTRSPQSISREIRSADTLIFPKDTKAGGAWVVTARSGRTACLLNGAFLKHHHQPPYRRSRGLVMLDFFEWPKPDTFFEQYELEGIEPFTFLFFQRDQVTEFRWDGAQRYRKDLSPKTTHFWCSATLYPPPMQIRREQVFRDWWSQNGNMGESRLPAAIRELHLTGKVGDPENDFVMNRGGRVCTVSVTQVIASDGHARMRYSDLLEGFQHARRLRFVNETFPRSVD